MECIPACKTCDGRCLVPVTRPANQQSQATNKREGAASHQASRPLAYYIHLTCGHITTAPEQLVYSGQRPKRGLCYCEQCSKWTAKVKPPKPPKQADEPLF